MIRFALRRIKNRIYKKPGCFAAWLLLFWELGNLMLFCFQTVKAVDPVGLQQVGQEYNAA